MWCSDSRLWLTSLQTVLAARIKITPQSGTKLETNWHPPNASRGCAHAPSLDNTPRISLYYGKNLVIYSFRDHSKTTTNSVTYADLLISSQENESCCTGDEFSRMKGLRWEGTQSLTTLFAMPHRNHHVKSNITSAMDLPRSL